jgi:glycosyltransferase involved in cell wall biosynthesis
MHIVLWGTYDTGKPRVRILIKGLRSNGVTVTECHASIWQGVEDKSQVTGVMNKIKLLFRWLLSYPVLIYRYLRTPKHDGVLVSYMGHLDVLILWPFAKLRGTPIIWDAFLSLYNTVVQDRRMLGRRNPAAMLLYAWEWTACRAAGKIILDTRKHADYFMEQYSLDSTRVYSVFVGAEHDHFYPVSYDVPEEFTQDVSVLFYGQFIPLHGIDVIIRAANILRKDKIQWQLIGQGQEAGRIRNMIDQLPPLKLEWTPWVEYGELNTIINRADVCLGIFGATDKARMVIPNKVYQIISAGAPLITMDSPAIRELVRCDCGLITLVPENSPEALAEAVLAITKDQRRKKDSSCCKEISKQITPPLIGKQLLDIILN